MAYQALYRKLRPKRFSDVFGQDNIVKTLQNQILNNKIAHAYLFCGTRGTGKTSLAKIMARAVNCLNPNGAEPCGKCESCISQNDDSNMDVLELDAASRNGIDDMRELLDMVSYPPQVSKYKVYIIDEVHMLSTAAFNALLKTLEEPPSHVIFILATTEQQKIPATILSRCQKFDLSRIPSKLIYTKMQVALDDINIAYDQDALLQIALVAEGSVRDAWSILDICISSLQTGNKLDTDIVNNMLGTSKSDFVFKIAQDIIDSNQLSIMQGIDMLMQNGKEVQVFIKQLSKHFRDMLISKLSKDNIDETISDDKYKRLKLQAKNISASRIIEIIDSLMKSESDMRWSSSTRVLLESALLKISLPQGNISTQSITEDLVNIISTKINALESSQHNIQNEIKAIPQNINTIAKKTDNESKKTQLIKPTADTHEIWRVARNKIEDNGVAGLVKAQTLHKDNEGYYILYNKNDYFLASTLKKQDAEIKIKEAIESCIGNSINFTIRVSKGNNVQSFVDAEAELRKTLPDDIIEVRD